MLLKRDYPRIKGACKIYKIALSRRARSPLFLWPCLSIQHQCAELDYTRRKTKYNMLYLFTQNVNDHFSSVFPKVLGEKKKRKRVYCFTSIVNYPQHASSPNTIDRSTHQSCPWEDIKRIGADGKCWNCEVLFS